LGWSRLRLPYTNTVVVPSPSLPSPWPGIIGTDTSDSVMTIALLIALAGSLVLMAVIVKRLEQA
jgi:hypothetical protein